jgi:hypothetical protein
VTVSDLVTASREAGIRLSVNGDRLVLEAAEGAVTPALRDELKMHKADLLPVLVRLEGMRRNGVDLTGKGPQPPVPCALFEAVGGPGRCFSCGDALPHPTSYGRCTPCDVAKELFYRERPASADMELIA